MMGTDLGVIGAVKEFISSAGKILKTDKLDVFIGGGDSKILIDNIPNVKKAPDDITLRGIAAIWRDNNKN